MLQKLMPTHHYNEQMGSVDIADQLLEPYDPTRKKMRPDDIKAVYSVLT